LPDGAAPGRLDELERAAVSDRAPALAARRIDVSTLVSYLTGHLRLDDALLGRLATQVDGRTPPDLAAPTTRGETPCSCASTPSVTSTG
jgi:hypothetical protein